MGIGFRSTGSFDKTAKWLEKLARGDFYNNLDSYGQAGVEALASATPKRSGLTADSWEYRIVNTGSGRIIEWFNTNIQNGTEIAILIQYGHGTGTGGYVQGIDYINPAILPVYVSIIDDVMKEVSQ